LNTTIPFSEESLITGLQQKKEQAFAVLYDKYSAAMLGIINNLVTDAEEAENILQDVFVKIFKSIHLYDKEKGRLFTWLITICRNTALNYLRSAQNIAAVKIQNDGSSVYTQRLITEPEYLDNIGISKAVQKLDSNQRVIINLIYYWGYTQQEAAEKLNLPLGTVKTRTRAALQILKEHLSE
jgi:RNA polymerase sigma factor (sigma-70 family)